MRQPNPAITPDAGHDLAIVKTEWVNNEVFASGSIIAVLQVTVPPDVQGRVFTLLQSGGGAMAPLGLMISGPLADALGVRAWFLAAGVAVVVIGLGAFLVPDIMHIEDRAANTATTGDRKQTSTSSKVPAVRASVG